MFHHSENLFLLPLVSINMRPMHVKSLNQVSSRYIVGAISLFKANKIIFGNCTFTEKSLQIKS